jgi:hypothetical protein
VIVLTSTEMSNTMKEDPMNTDHFKTCPCCNHIWQKRNLFLSDSALLLNGYQADFESLEEGLLFFTHEDGDCFSTLAMDVGDFIDLYTGPRWPERKTGTKACPGHCLDKNNLEPCQATCECAVVRELLQLIKSSKACSV